MIISCYNSSMCYYNNTLCRRKLMSCQCALADVAPRERIIMLYTPRGTDELLIWGSVLSMSSEQKKKDEVESENVKLAAWDLISKYFSLEALGKFEFLFKIINLKGDSVMTSLEMDDFLYGAGVDFKASKYEAIYKACTHGENEMDLGRVLDIYISTENSRAQRIRRFDGKACQLAV